MEPSVIRIQQDWMNIDDYKYFSKYAKGKCQTKKVAMGYKRLHCKLLEALVGCIIILTVMRLC